MNIEIIDIQGMLPNISILGSIEEYREYMIQEPDGWYVSLAGLTIIYTVDGEQKEYTTTKDEYFFKNSDITMDNYNKFKSYYLINPPLGSSVVLNLEYLFEAFEEYRENKEQFLQRVKEYYGIRLS